MTKTAVAEVSAEDQVVADDKQAQADFDAGAAQETSKTTPAGEQKPRDDSGRFVSSKTEAKPEDKTGAKPEDKPVEQPKYVQLTEEQYNRLDAAAKRTDDFEKQMSKAFGTIGDMQKIVKMLQSQTPRGVAVKIPDDAFADMQKNFPDLVEPTRKALEATLKGLEGTGSATAEIDVAELDKKVEARALKFELEALEDAFPDWQQIVGAVKEGEKPDENNAFRKWLATKDKVYQDRINGTNSAGVITRAIRTFRSEKKKASAIVSKKTETTQGRSDRITEGVRPKGDGGQPPAKNDDDEFQAGFKSG